MSQFNPVFTGKTFSIHLHNEDPPAWYVGPLQDCPDPDCQRRWQASATERGCKVVAVDGDTITIEAQELR